MVICSPAYNSKNMYGHNETLITGLAIALIVRKEEKYVFFSYKKHLSVTFESTVYEARYEKTGLRGFRPGPTQTGLCSHRRCLEA